MTCSASVATIAHGATGCFDQLRDGRHTGNTLHYIVKSCYQFEGMIQLRLCNLSLLNNLCWHGIKDSLGKPQEFSARVNHC